MSKLAASHGRILKIRSIQRRMAEVQLVQSETEMRHISDLADRIASLRHAISCKGGVHRGTEVRANCEMTTRLDTARQAMDAPLVSAIGRRMRRHDDLNAAREREMGADKLAELATKREKKELEYRQNASRIFRKANADEGAVS